MRKIRDLSGQKFGRLTAVERKGKDKTGHSVWLCRCECGEMTDVRISSLTSGSTKSCGCLNRERMNGATKDGKRTRLYQMWRNMKERCQNPNRHDYQYYGGRGISIKGWDNFEEFKKWSLNNGYGKTLEIDRINNSGDYCPSNCRFVTRSENIKNSRHVEKITFKGETKSILGWAREQKIKYTTLYNRIKKLDWPVEKALTEPVRGSENEQKLEKVLTREVKDE